MRSSISAAFLIYLMGIVVHGSSVPGDDVEDAVVANSPVNAPSDIVLSAIATPASAASTMTSGVVNTGAIVYSVSSSATPINTMPATVSVTSVRASTTLSYTSSHPGAAGQPHRVHEGGLIAGLALAVGVAAAM